MWQLGQICNKNTSAAWLDSNLLRKLIKCTARPRLRASSWLIYSSVVCLCKNVFEYQIICARLWYKITIQKNVHATCRNNWTLSQFHGSFVVQIQLFSGIRSQGIKHKANNDLKTRQKWAPSPLTTFSISFPSYPCAVFSERAKHTVTSHQHLMKTTSILIKATNAEPGFDSRNTNLWVQACQVTVQQANAALSLASLCRSPSRSGSFQLLSAIKDSRDK